MDLYEPALYSEREEKREGEEKGKRRERKEGREVGEQEREGDHGISSKLCHPVEERHFRGSTLHWDFLKSSSNIPI